MENPVGCSESPLPALNPEILQVTEHHGGLPEAEQQAEENCLIICKKSTAFLQGSSCADADFCGIGGGGIGRFPGKQTCLFPVLLETEVVDRCEVIFTCLKGSMKCIGRGKGKKII